MAFQPPDASRDIPTCEVLVHITAPTSARDDARLVSIAAAVLNFQPAKRTKVSGLDFISSCPLVTNTEIKATGQESSLKERHSRDSETNTDRHPVNDLAIGHNAEHTGLQTAQHRRICACPEALSFAKVSSSPPSKSPKPCRHDRSTANARHSTGCLVTDCSEDCGIGEKRRCSKRRRLSPAEYECTTARRQHSRQSEPYASTPQQSSTKVVFSKNHSSVPSTVSPSQPLYWQVPVCNSRDEWPGSELAARISMPIYPAMARQNEEVSQQETDPRRHGDGLTEAQRYNTARRPRRRQNLTSQLSDEVHGPNPQGGQARFVTHVTKTLRKLAIRLPLSKQFRPSHVTRDVNVLERGHWQFSIGIIESSMIRDPTQALQKRSHDELVSLWSEREFVQLWKNVCCFVQDGKAGWGTSMVKKQIGQGLWRIRLFTWAEILGHIWLVLWVLSDKMMEHVPMHWIDGRGTAVITMSGRKPKGKGKAAGSWVSKGPEGEQGYWGIQ